MHDYDVIVRIPIRERDLEDAHGTAYAIVDDIRDLQRKSELVSVECTGPSEET